MKSNSTGRQAPILIVGSRHRLTAVNRLLKLTLSPGHPDVLILDGRPHIGIDQVRFAKRFIAVPPLIHPRKYCLVFQAQNLTLEAQNAFLKTLEESPPYALIILVTRHQDSLLPTIRSRCILINDPSSSQPSPLPKYLQVYQDIVQADLGTKFLLAGRCSATKDKALSTLTNLLTVVRHRLLSRPSVSTLSDARRLHIGLALLDQNTNHKLVLEQVFIHLGHTPGSVAASSKA